MRVRVRVRVCVIITSLLFVFIGVHTIFRQPNIPTIEIRFKSALFRQPHIPTPQYVCVDCSVRVWFG